MRSCGLTVRGKQRETNQDSISLNDDIGLYIVADGMGGHEHGDIASSMAVKEISEYILDNFSKGTADRHASDDKITDLLKNAVITANSRIFDLSGGPRSGHTMGTTASFAFITGGKLFTAHVGDSRIYRMRQGRLKKLTHDHSWVQELVDQGLLSAAEAEKNPMSNIVTRALGTNETVEVDTTVFKIEDTDSFLLCSDGLTRAMDISTIEECIASNIPIKDKCRKVIEETVKSGAPDDVSVIILEPQG